MTMRRSTQTALAFGLIVGAATASLAQTPVQPQPRDPNMPSLQNTVPEKIESGPTSSTGTLSDRLQRSEGVITPPAMGSGMTVVPPVANPNSTPVIVPPGEPGGNQSVQPK
jgi:hypothetical protein